MRVRFGNRRRVTDLLFVLLRRRLALLPVIFCRFATQSSPPAFGNLFSTGSGQSLWSYRDRPTLRMGTGRVRAIKRRPLIVMAVSMVALGRNAHAAVRDRSLLLDFQLDLRGTVWAEAAREAGLVDPRLIYSIALFESGVDDGQGGLAPYPWMLGFAGRDVRASSQEDAVRRLAGITTGTNVDIGLMQVNWAAHHHRVGRPSDLLDPVNNVLIGGRILAEALQSAPGDLVVGLGRYHSYTPDRARWYGQAVWSLYSSLISTAPVRRRERLV